MEDVVLTSDQAELARTGTFVRVDLGGTARADDGALYRTAFVARRDARWLAYANVCRHQPVPLDIPDGVTDPATGLRVALIAEDGVSLMCASHGAVFQAIDGFCTTGPCYGQSLVAVAIHEAEGRVTLSFDRYQFPAPIRGKIA